MRRPLLLSFILLQVSGVVVFAQEGTMTVSASAGPSALFFREVDDDGRKDIGAYNRLGIPIGDYDPLSSTIALEGGIEFRFDRDVAFRLFGLSMTANTGTLYADSTILLRLDRELRSTDFGFDLIYFLPPLMYDMEAGLFVGIGRMTASATQETWQQHEQKSADTTVTIIDQDAFASYKKTKLYVRGGGRLSWMFSPPFGLVLQAVYKYAPLGSLDGSLREFSFVREHTTTIEFDFSSLDVKLGLSVTL